MRDKLIELMCGIFEDAGTAYPQTNAVAAADRLIANGVVVQKWVPLTERLPEDMQERVLVTTDCDSPIGNQQIDTDRCRHGEWVRYGNHVTHWMPLPEPPKEVK